MLKSLVESEKEVTLLLGHEMLLEKLREHRTLIWASWEKTRHLEVRKC